MQKNVTKYFKKVVHAKIAYFSYMFWNVNTGFIELLKYHAVYSLSVCSTRNCIYQLSLSFTIEFLAKAFVRLNTWNTLLVSKHFVKYARVLVFSNLYLLSSTCHCVKSVRIRSYFGLYFPVFNPNAGKYGPE